MCDIDMSSDSDFDTDVNSDFDVDTSSDFETIDSFDDIDATLTEDIDSFNTENTIDSFAELDVSDGIDDTSEFDNIGAVDDIIEDFSALDDVESLEFEEVSESVDSIKDEDIEILDFDDSDTKNLDFPSNLLDESDFSLEQLEGISDNLDIQSNEESIIENIDERDLHDLDELNSEENEISLFENELDTQDQLSNTDLESAAEPYEPAENVEEMLPEESNVALDNLNELIDSSNDIDQLRELRDALTAGETMVNFGDADDINDIDHINESEASTKEPELSQSEMSVEELASSENAVVEEMDRPEHVAIDELAEMFDGEENIDDWRTVRDSISSGNLIVDSPEMIDDSPKTLTRDISPELQESIAENTENILDNYRENLELHNVSEENIEDYINQARENLDAEFNSAINNTPSENIHYQPNDWNEVADSLNTQQEFFNEHNETPTLTTEIEQQFEQNNNDTQEMNIDYDEIYDEIQRGALEQGFENVHIDEDPERLNSSLESFNEDIWKNLSLDEQKIAMYELADYVVDVVGFDDPPTIEYYYNEKEGDFGGYNLQTNTLRVNEYMLYNSNEAADTIAHELWHAHQYECAMNPQSALDYQYQYNFENYIDPSLGQKEYESQLVEAEARAFASQFKDRIKHISRR